MKNPHKGHLVESLESYKIHLEHVEKFFFTRDARAMDKIGVVLDMTVTEGKNSIFTRVI